jgi:tetratricopeptide (TPR) repeat protein
VPTNDKVGFNQAGDFAEAAIELKKALSYRFDFPEAHLNLANALRGLLKYEEADAEYKKVLASGKGGSDVLFNLGILYLDMEREFAGGNPIARYKTAKEYLEKAKNAGLSPDDEKRVAEYIKEVDKKIKQKETDIERDKKRKIKEKENDLRRKN